MKQLEMWEEVQPAMGKKPTVERRKGRILIPQKNLPQKRAYLTIKSVYHPAIECF